MSGPSASHPGNHAGRAGTAALDDLRTALAMLTALPLRPVDARSTAGGRATLFFPIIGLCMGTALWGCNWLLASRLPRWMAAVMLVAVWEGLSRGHTLWAWRQPRAWSDERPACRRAGV